MYEALSDYYDLFSDGDDRERAEYVSSFLPEGGRGADLGCGTGGITLELARRGYDVTGFDSSEGMLASAFTKAAELDVRVDFVLKNVFGGGFGKRLDFVTACCDVVNYVRRPLGFFRKVYNSLTDGGVFAFDVSSEFKIKNLLANNVFTATENGVTYVWENFLYKDRIDMFLTFFARRPDGTYDRATDEQTQFIHTERQLVDALTEVGFTVKVYGYGTRRKPSEKCERLQFVSLKKERNENGKNS